MRVLSRTVARLDLVLHSIQSCHLAMKGRPDPDGKGCNMRIVDIMKQRVATIGMDDTLETVRDFFASAPFHHLLVIEEEHLVGILSDKDLYKALSPFLGSGSENQRDR